MVEIGVGRCRFAVGAVGGGRAAAIGCVVVLEIAVVAGSTGPFGGIGMDYFDTRSVIGTHSRPQPVALS